MTFAATSAAVYAIRQRGIAPLVRACDALSYRLLPGRLCGGFAYHPYEGWVTRGRTPSSPHMRGPAEALAGSDANDLWHSKQTPESLHRAGVSQLVAGKKEQGVLALEDSLLEASDAPDLATALAETNDAATVSDLAAGYLSRANGPDSLDALASLNAAERAWEIARTPEIAWNRALAYSATSHTAAALGAWNDFLDFDSTSAWSTEARGRMNAISGSPLPSRDEMRKALLTAMGSSDSLLRAAAPNVGMARVIGEEEFLPAWGRADETSLIRASRIGAVVAQLGADSTLADTVARIQVLDITRRGDARAALASYADGRKKMAQFAYADSLPLLRAAAATFDRLGVPLSARTNVWIATSLYQAGQIDASLSVCTRAVARPDIERYPSVIAQCAWNEALIEAGLRHYDRSRAAYEKSRRLFERMGDTMTVASIDVRLEENERLTGDVAAAWMHMSRSLRKGLATPGTIALCEAARVAEAADMPFAALAFYDRGVDAARTNPERVHALLSRAKLLDGIGREDAARIDINAATRFQRSVTDAATSPILESYLTLARSNLKLHTRPEDVVREVDGAIAVMVKAGNYREIARARCLQAKAHLARGDVHSAETSLSAALTEIESQRQQITADEERLALVDTANEATELLVALHFDQHRAEAALADAERSKARLLLDALGRSEVGPTTTLWHAEANEAVVEYVVLPSRTLIWSITERGVRAHSVSIARRQLEKWIDEWQRALVAGDEETVHGIGSRLTGVLLAPVWLDIANGHKILFVADGPLLRVPFSALPTPSSSTFLIEEREVSTVPSITWLGAMRSLAREEVQRSRVTVAVPSVTSVGGEEEYAYLPSAERDARAIAARLPKTRLLVGDESTAEYFSNLAAESQILHFAGHSVPDKRRPGRSALVMAGGRLLYASDIARWHLPHTNLVVLAACSTGSGSPTSDGAASVARAFLLAGARSTIATLWPIEDESASALTRSLYEGLASGRDAADALRSAQRLLIASPSSHSRYGWAAFQFIGS
jgi:CHAT domain-containing protein